MGTNYYAQYDACEHCGRPERTIHIGKNSGGWVFSFEGHDFNYEPLDTDIVSIRSWKDWQAVLSRSKFRVVNEYGETVTLADLVALVDATRSNKLTMISYHDQLRNAWVDPEGFSFSLGEFS